MDNLLFYSLIAILIYYFLVYLPQQKKNLRPDPPTFQHQSTQTDPVTIETEPGPETLNGPAALTQENQKALEETLDQMTKSMLELSKELDKI